MIRRFADLEAMSRAASDHIAERIRGAGRFSIALSGGHTPSRLYELLGQRQDIDWSRVHLLFGDDRYVPPDDPRSNEGMVREKLVSRIEIPAANFLPMYSAAGWQESADRYDGLLREFFAGRPYTFDLALQGMGDDGHTASIFPGTPSPPPGRWVVATSGTKEAPERVSVTLDCLAASKEVLFLVAGESKAERLREIMDGADYPAGELVRKAAYVEWWVDEAAGRLIT
ncbi:MAG TPA: 6-phosphogluconolactonase [Fimbriimonadaceae bacterium]|nr:6-phosphogluconolactonase [Fimbriimonadaceae bacterium]